MPSGARRRAVVIALVGSVAVLGATAIALYVGSGDRDAATHVRDAAPGDPVPPTAAARPDGSPQPPAATGSARGASAPEEAEEAVSFELEQAVAWSMVDMEAVREALPDNLYWKLAAPTDDPRVLRERERIREEWNEQYGKVLSNTGTEQEVRDYYAERQRLSSDYVEFTDHLLQHYGDVLPERDVGLLKLAQTLHLARLEELPRNLARALERREAHAAAREAWRAQQEAFAEGEAGGSSP